MNTYETDGKKYELLCKCNTGLMRFDYACECGYTINFVKDYSCCKICYMTYYYDPTKPLFEPIEFLTEEEMEIE